MLREDSFVKNLPDEYKKEFIDDQEMAPEKLKILKKMIANRFPVSTEYVYRKICFLSKIYKRFSQADTFRDTPPLRTPQDCS